VVQLLPRAKTRQFFIFFFHGVAEPPHEPTNEPPLFFLSFFLFCFQFFLNCIILFFVYNF
jgi:hypothetical protein